MADTGIPDTGIPMEILTPMETVTLAEDPVSFLANIREECPDIFSIFTTDRVRMLSRNPTDPYTEGKVDEEYLLDASIQQVFRVAWKKSTFNLTNFLLMPEESTKAFNAEDLETFERKKRALEKVYTYEVQENVSFFFSLYR